MKEQYNIDDLVRMMKKSTNQKLPQVKALITDQKSHEELVKNGFIKIGFPRIRVTAWRGGVALCIKRSLNRKTIILESTNEVIGIMIDLTDNSSIAIFSIYVSPTTQLDTNLFTQILLNFLERTLKRELTKFKDSQLTDKFKQLSVFNQSNSKDWKLLKKLDNDSTNDDHPLNLKINNQNITDEFEIANKFAENLFEIFTEKNPSDSPPINSGTHGDSTFNSNTREEFIKALKNLKNNAAPGSDGINNTILKRLPLNYLNRIFNFFNASLKLGHVSAIWKSSLITMIPKKDKPRDEISSYRPISLINCISKWLEKIINEKLKNWVESENLLPTTQAGFRKNKRTHDQILRLNQDILSNFNKKRLTGAVFFDLEKAFDKTPHSGIMESINSLNIGWNIKKWIESFLENRNFKVKVKNASSSIKNISCGLPQGSCLSPTLFIIYFSGIAKVIKELVHHAIYADDLVIWVSGANKK
ncbi:unnamed protein product [Brachionus calyciflorus]|uniref:Reverse transcriptase domain-containing protein n=1 Tax=Brachionus calyciflorus TaxID=104777 RepID=A0A814HJP3_9BILA|nr:unnamed protein product [Brachionus calyciflorus]